MLPENKPVAELEAIQKLIETYKDSLTCVQKDNGYYFTEKNRDNGFYFWIKYITTSLDFDGFGEPISNPDILDISFSSKPFSKFNLEEGNRKIQIGANELFKSLYRLLFDWLNVIEAERSFDYTKFDKLVPKTFNTSLAPLLTTDTLKQLQISNFKGISDLTINFDEQVTIILGKNASGKTSVLQALALALLPDDNTDKDREFEKMIKMGCPYAKINNFFSKNDFFDQVIIIEQNRKRGNSPTYICPILLGYGTNMFYDKREKNKYQDFVKLIIAGNAKHYFTRSLFRNFDDTFLDVLDVLNHLYYEEPREKEETIRNNSKEIRTVVAQTINSLLPKDLIQIKLVEERSYYFVNQAGDNLDTDQLSEGYRANVILLGDMLCRLMAMRKYVQETTPIAEVFKEMRGVVAIDEFDRHLHPSWQKVFVDNLLAVLPNMQFVLTTHNPMAILNRKENEVLKLVFDYCGKNKVRDVPFVRKLYKVEVVQM